MRTDQLEKGGPSLPARGGKHVTMIADDEMSDTDALSVNEDSSDVPTGSSVQYGAEMLGAVNEVKNEVAGANGSHRTVIWEPEYDTPNGDMDATAGATSTTVTGENTTICMLVIAGTISDAFH